MRATSCTLVIAVTMFAATGRSSPSGGLHLDAYRDSPVRLRTIVQLPLPNGARSAAWSPAEHAVAIAARNEVRIRWADGRVQARAFPFPLRTVCWWEDGTRIYANRSSGRGVFSWHRESDTLASFDIDYRLELPFRVFRSGTTRSAVFFLDRLTIWDTNEPARTIYATTRRPGDVRQYAFVAIHVGDGRLIEVEELFVLPGTRFQRVVLEFPASARLLLEVLEQGRGGATLLTDHSGHILRDYGATFTFTAVTPDERWLIGCSPGDGPTSELMTLEVATGDVGLLTRTENIAEMSPALSPDGRRLASIDEEEREVRLTIYELAYPNEP